MNVGSNSRLPVDATYVKRKRFIVGINTIHTNVSLDTKCDQPVKVRYKPCEKPQVHKGKKDKGQEEAQVKKKEESVNRRLRKKMRKDKQEKKRKKD